MKITLTFILFLLILLVGTALVIRYYPDNVERASIGLTGNVISDIGGERVIIDKNKSLFEFEGYGVGMSYVGVFDDWEGSLIYDDELVGFEGRIKSESVNTGISGLDEHLRNEDFFEVEKYPEIFFISDELGDGMVTGILSFKGVDKEISFPAEIGEDFVSAEFLLDTSSFGFVSTGVNKDVRIKFEFWV